ncbi:BTAD domain-containing putative transcriptional regulator [Roseomonas sp. HF4]|uniref:BTAD domain-containing putative transcriptional regulator n=1 Tax=Roseomonas sp. HF4 TaxID=2562313 RepID=UPI001485484C|nr:BTAD domain-containing putative transcriptional regulator [Roseomonas sp. HF4]
MELHRRRIDIRLLGRLGIRTASGAELPLQGPKIQALLSYLATRPGQPEHRDRLATLLWADRGQEQARHSLRQAILTLRRALTAAEIEPFATDGPFVGLDPGVVSTDLAPFETLARSDDLDALKAAATIYRGNFLDGLAIASEPFTEWLEAERTRLRDLTGGILLRLARRQAASGEPDAAAATVRRALQLDPAFEECHRLLMDLLRRSGQRTAALRQYQACIAALQREVGAEPVAATRRLAEEIRCEQAAPAVTDAAEAPRPAPDTAGGTEARVSPRPTAAPQPEAAPQRGQRPGLRPSATLAITAFGAMALGLGLARDHLWWPSNSAVRGVAELPSAAFPLPDRPSIVVLPFRNLSIDPAHAVLVDGITEEITAALSMVSGIFVISRTTALTYRDGTADIRRIARELGVRHVLDGSVMVENGRVRVLANLIDTAQDRLVWTHRHQDQVAGVFGLNDAITLEVITALNVLLVEGEQERVALVHGTRNLQAWLLAGSGLQHIRRFTPADNAEARRLYRRSLEHAPDYPGAAHGLAWTYFIEARFGWSEDPVSALRQAAAIAEATLALDPNHPASFSLLGGVALAAGRHAEAVSLAERAIALSPNGADVTAVLAFILTYSGEPRRAAMLLERAMRLSPYYPHWYRWTLGRALRQLGETERAIAALSAGQATAPQSIAPLVELAAALAEAGRDAEARATAARAMTMAPGFSIGEWLRVPPHALPQHAAQERAALLRAAFPE